MNDRELLELAAKAAGLKLKFRALTNMPGCVETCFSVDAKGATERWNPIERDGDALRLAVKLGIGIEFYPDHDSVRAIILDNFGESTECSAEMDDYGTRYAIVNVAAEIGRSMP